MADLGLHPHQVERQVHLGGRGRRAALPGVSVAVSLASPSPAPSTLWSGTTSARDAERRLTPWEWPRPADGRLINGVIHRHYGKWGQRLSVKRPPESQDALRFYAELQERTAVA